ncbi:unnamed protein product [Arabis nemorensis]|uniref:Uncharacterized protein n=1 Tax=Arabis nemorensis TaxID=586526 RepID=A0A565BRL4_9BRAS|nr:unnamed protein product [Arabis nemorensis]
MDSAFYPEFLEPSSMESRYHIEFTKLKLTSKCGFGRVIHVLKKEMLILMMKRCEKEATDVAGSKELYKERLMRLSWALVLSHQAGDVQCGIGMLEAFLANSDPPLKHPKKLHLLVVMKPGWRQALVLKESIQDKNGGSGDDEEKELLSKESSGSYDDEENEHLSKEKDLLMVHLLRTACSSKELLSDSLLQITGELIELGLLHEGVLELALSHLQTFISFSMMHTN